MGAARHSTSSTRTAAARCVWHLSEEWGGLVSSSSVHTPRLTGAHSTRSPTVCHPVAGGGRCSPFLPSHTLATSHGRCAPPQIDASELKATLNAMGQNPTEEEIFQMISQVDDDNSGEIEFAEFLKVIENQKASAAKANDETDTIEAFVALGGQTDKTGAISVEKLRAVVKVRASARATFSSFLTKKMKPLIPLPAHLSRRISGSPLTLRS